MKELYYKWVIPLTKEVEVRYLRQRLNPVRVAFAAVPGPALGRGIGRRAALLFASGGRDQ